MQMMYSVCHCNSMMQTCPNMSGMTAAHTQKKKSLYAQLYILAVCMPPHSDRIQKSLSAESRSIPNESPDPEKERKRERETARLAETSRLSLYCSSWKNTLASSCCSQYLRPFTAYGPGSSRCAADATIRWMGSDASNDLIAVWGTTKDLN